MNATRPLTINSCKLHFHAAKQSVENPMCTLKNTCVHTAHLAANKPRKRAREQHDMTAAHPLTAHSFLPSPRGPKLLPTGPPPQQTPLPRRKCSPRVVHGAARTRPPSGAIVSPLYQCTGSTMNVDISLDGPASG